MTAKQFNTVWEDALVSHDKDAFSSDWALSSLFLENEGTDIDYDLYAQLRTIWDAAHMSVKEMIVSSGLDMTQASERFCIPYRTIQDWCAGRREPPDYVRLMMAESLRMLERK